MFVFPIWEDYSVNIEHKIKLKVKCKASDLIPAAILAISKAELAPLTLSWARPGEWRELCQRHSGFLLANVEIWNKK